MILVIGDLILDDYRIIDINRISPEAPCLVGKHIDEYYRLGGAANVANNIKVLTDELLLVGECCKDTMHPLLCEAEIPNLVKYGKNSTKVRFIDKKTRTQVFRYDVEEVESKEHPTELMHDFPTLPPHDYSVQVIVDYLKGTINKVAQVKCPINLFSTKNPYPSRLIKHKNEHNILVLNKGEFNNADKESLKEFSYIVRTEGEEGISLFHALSLLIIKNFEALKVDVFDVTGAGDTVTAVLAFCLSHFGFSEENLARACFCANVEAAKVITMHGTTVVTSTKRDIIEMFQRLEY